MGKDMMPALLLSVKAHLLVLLGEQGGVSPHNP
jgi:hypothetical protein